MLAALWATHNLLDSRPGRALRALKGGLEMAEAFGVNGARLKIVAFVYAALLAVRFRLAYAHLQRFVNPTPFGINQGIEYLFMAVVGGAGSVWGAIIGATLITLLKQMLQDVLPRLLGRAGNFEIVVFGVLMVLLLQFARDGVWPWIARLCCRGASRAPIADAPPLPVARADRTAARARCSRCSGRARQFGGLVAVNDLIVRHSRRRNPRPDRPQRRRQEHDVRPDQRRAAVDRRARSSFAANRSGRASRTGSRGSASAARSSTCACCRR